MISEKVKDIVNNKEFVTKLETIPPEEMKNLFAEYNVTLTDEEILEFVREAVEEDKGEITLGEEDLEIVSGGIAVTIALAMLGWTWTYAESVYGSRAKAVSGIISYWKKKFK